MLLVLGALVLYDDEPAFPHAGDNWLAEIDLQYHTFGRYCNPTLEHITFATVFK